MLKNHYSLIKVQYVDIVSQNRYFINCNWIDLFLNEISLHDGIDMNYNCIKVSR